MHCFIVRGFGKKKDSERTEFDFDAVERDLIAPAIARCGLQGGTTAEITDSGSIHDDMYARLLEADLVVCDITVHNANVFYELGVRHALRRKRTVLIKGEPSADKTPFDIGGFRHLGYPAANPAAAVQALADTLRATIDSDRPTDSPVFHALPRLREAPADVAVPLDFLERVQRARAARDKAALEAMALDLMGQRFHLGGLREVARAQFKLQDHDAARRHWSAVLAERPEDVEALFALANIDERAFRDSDRPEQLERSDQALARVLALPTLAQNERAEAAALCARNLKTRWRRRFRDATDEGPRRALACDRLLLESHDRYREAFFQDLNNFYPGLAALQMGHLAVSLQDEPGWPDLFDSERDERLCREDLAQQLPELAAAVRLSIERTLALKSAPEGDKEWARISRADLRFLCDDAARLQANPAGLVGAYRQAVPEPDTFAWGAVTGQLALFASLGFRAGVARHVIDQLKAPARG